MMTLRYSVQNMALDGSAPPGLQLVRIFVGHLQHARAARVIRAAMQVSFDGGKTWHHARVVGRDGSYTAVFAAPPGARVTLRTSAADAAGGSVTETITSAYASAA
jgi:Neuraminidase (sialidase)